MSKARSKSDTLYDRIHADIMSLALGPDTPLRMPVLSERYDIGATPLRECLNRLGGDRLVVPEHNKGFRVAPVTLADLLDLERSRNAIEGAMVADSILRGRDGWEAGIAGTFHQLTRTAIPSPTVDDGAMALWNRRHGAFHAALVAGSESRWMHRFADQLGVQLGRYHRFIESGLRDLARTAPALAGEADDLFATAMAVEPHRTLHDAALDRDPDAARAAFDTHVDLTIAAFEGLKTLMPAGSSLTLLADTPPDAPQPETTP